MTKDDVVANLSKIGQLVHDMAKSDQFDLYLTKHCKERMQERGITAGDIMNVLKYGIVEELIGQCDHPNNDDIFKYRMIGPFFGDEKLYREIGVVLLIEVHSKNQLAIKIQDIITVMWRTKR